jgi:precorrin-6B methylase 2
LLSLFNGRLVQDHPIQSSTSTIQKGWSSQRKAARFVSLMLKSLYVRSVRGMGTLARLAGLIRLLERMGNRRYALWLRSLFAIYDSRQLLALDLPWWSFGAIDALTAFMGGRQGLRVYEYGAGSSTIWLARRGCTVFSVEHDPDWYETFKSSVAGFNSINLRLVQALRSPTCDCYRSDRDGWKECCFRNYVHSIDAIDGVFDLIVIDGRSRVACFAHAKSRLAPGGVIIFDNANRSRYQKAFKDPDFLVHFHNGLTVSLPYPDSTALISRR